jgi:hypothetical protein
MDQILPPKLNAFEFETLRQIAAHPASHHTFRPASNLGSRISASRTKCWAASFRLMTAYSALRRTNDVWAWSVIRRPSWTGNESISRNPSGVPILDGCTAHGTFKTADLARLFNVFAADIDRAALTSSMGTNHWTSSPPHSNSPTSQGVRIFLSGSRLPLAASFIPAPLAPSRRKTLIDPLDALAVVIPQANKRPQRLLN